MNSCMKVCSLSCKSKSIRVGDGKHTLKMFQLALTKLSHAKLLLKQLLHFRCCHCFGKCQHPVWLVDGWCLCHYVFLHFWIQELKQSMEQKLLQTKFSRGRKRHACPTHPPPIPIWCQGRLQKPRLLPGFATSANKYMCRLSLSYSAKSLTLTAYSSQSEHKQN